MTTYIHLQDADVNSLLTKITAKMAEKYIPYGGLLVVDAGFGQTMILKTAPCVQKMLWSELYALGPKVPASAL